MCEQESNLLLLSFDLCCEDLLHFEQVVSKLGSVMSSNGNMLQLQLLKLSGKNFNQWSIQIFKWRCYMHGLTRIVGYSLQDLQSIATIFKSLGDVSLRLTNHWQKLR